MENLKVNLRSGEKIPALGFGTGVVRLYSRNPYLFLKTRIRPLLSSIKHWRLDYILKSDLYMERFIYQALEENYRLFDTGRIYGYSEKMIGCVIRASGITREEFFLVTKISDMDITRASSPNDVRGNLEDSLRYLGTSYVDAYLLHWPHGEWIDIYRQMEQLYDEGLARAIGVCNFTIEHFAQLEQYARITPMICQLELHPLNSKREIREYCREHGIVVMAHTPTGRMYEKIRQNRVLQEIAHRHEKTIPQIIIRWHYQNDVVPVVATQSSIHMQENADIFDFSLSETEMQQIEDQDEGYVILPGNGIDNPNYIYNL
ncbi:aldo/keto reductase [uncultured Selenomonas sp.]|uniref:aldo/keto reductase family protein n=1 Tax=uncultured Selenomonas sp. TaxID=159275 RepID=UPI0028E9A924|nr:aldo/keto reductase [uncultured Selenomonas sp.]